MIRKPIFSLLTAGILSLVGPMQQSEATPLNLSNVPLPLLNSVAPNIIFTVDDSGSMAWAYMPDGISGISGNARGCSSELNKIYYDPTRTYDPPVTESGTPLNATPATFSAAYIDGFNTGTGTVDLGTNYRPSWSGLTSYGTCGQTVPSAAFYFTYSTACGNPNSDACYTKVTVTAASTEAQNFANWYSYYRNRNMLAKTAAGRAFSKVGTDVRLAYQRINSCTQLGVNPPSVAACTGSYVKQFTGANRSTFFTWLYSSGASGSTPLVQAFERAGAYVQTSNVNSPWAESPGVTIGTEHSCRQNFHIAFTDGLWNGGSSAFGNVDNTSVASLPTYTGGTVTNPGSYTPGSPSSRRIFADTNSGYLADVAFKYWIEDARPTLTNDVPQHITDTTGSNAEQFWNPRNDPAMWQHLVNFTVGMGIVGNRNFEGDYNSLLNGSLAWGNNVVDDLWHAAVNSRGQYFNATNASTLADSLSSIINDIGSRSGSGAGAAGNGAQLTTESQVFVSKYFTSGWAGQLLSYSINPTDGTVSATPNWDAAEKLRTQNWDTGRKILTFNPVTNQGKPFRWSDLNPTQQGYLDINPATLVNDGQGSARLEYLRGSSLNEGTGNDYRSRVCYNGSTVVTCPLDGGRLGDISHSTPLFVGPPMAFYPDNIESSPYSTFAASHSSRTPMLFFGANDGMVHGIDVSSSASNQGKELLAYVPSEVFPQLNQLTHSSYSHRFYVDGRMTQRDVYITPRGATGPEWRSVLVGGMRNGGKAYYALDVTNPSAFSESASAANQTVLWEFTDTELGYTHSQPVIAKMANGKWAAIFGNGYNNTGTGRGYLYIAFISDGIDGWSTSDFVKIDTGVGTAATPNGLTTPAVVDTNGDYIADYIYVGDLQGNMWRFNVTSTNPSTWASVSSRRKLFAAQTSGGTPQPITTMPQVVQHPAGLGGVLVVFGTGKFLEPADNTTAGIPTQSLYGIWDKMTGPFSTVQRGDLLAQTLTTATTVGGDTVRVVTDNAMTWRLGSTASSDYLGWVVDLPTAGERSITESRAYPGFVSFGTYIPTTQPCVPGGSGWRMDLDLNNGGQLDVAHFDVDGNGSIDPNDYVDNGGQPLPPTGVPTQGSVGIDIIVNTGLQIPINPGGTGQCREWSIEVSPTGTVEKVERACTLEAIRQNWRQVK